MFLHSWALVSNGIRQEKSNNISLFFRLEIRRVESTRAKCIDVLQLGEQLIR